MISAFAIDPGETTGWAWTCFNTGTSPLDAIEGFRSGQVDCFDENQGAVQILDLARRAGAKALELNGGRQVEQHAILEDFILRQRTMARDLLSPVRLSSKIEFNLVVYDGYEVGVDIHYQQPSDAKSIITDKRMKAWGLWQPGQPHACDAIRHLLLWLRKR